MRRTYILHEINFAKCAQDARNKVYKELKFCKKQNMHDVGKIKMPLRAYARAIFNCRVQCYLYLPVLAVIKPLM